MTEREGTGSQPFVAIGAVSNYVDVLGLDAIDSTPVLDIKPYYPAYDRIESPSVPTWVSELMKDYF